MSEEVIKKPHSKSSYTEETLMELAKCVDDPLYFIKTFVKVQHPTKGTLPFIPYPYQERILNACHEHRFSVILTSRQAGKSLQYDSTINCDNQNIKIGALINHTLKERVVSLLENILIKLRRSIPDW